MKQLVYYSVYFLAATLVPLHSQAWDIGFYDIPFFIKTKLSGKDLSTIEFFFCRIDKSNEEKGECLKLSSCTYNEKELGRKLDSIKDAQLKEEFGMIAWSSYQSKIKSPEYLAAFLKLLDTLDEKRECLMVTDILFPKEGEEISVKVRLDKGFSVPQKSGAADLESVQQGLQEKLIVPNVVETQAKAKLSITKHEKEKGTPGIASGTLVLPKNVESEQPDAKRTH